MIREKKRYLRVKLNGEEKFTKEKANALIHSAVLDFLGEKGASVAGISIKEYREERQLAIVKCSLSSYPEVLSALSLKRFYCGKSVLLRVEKASGVLAKL